MSAQIIMWHCWIGMSCLLLSFIAPSLSSEYFVVAKNGVSCPEGYVCHDLSYYVNQSVAYFTSDTTLTFLEGTHILDQDGPVVISGVHNLTLRGEGKAVVNIVCNGNNSGILVKDFNDITFSDFTVSKCGYVLPEEIRSYILAGYYVDEYNWEYVVSLSASFSVLLINGTEVSIERFSVQNGTGYGLAAVNVYGIEMLSSSFSRNNIDCDPDAPSNNSGGNVRIAYIDSTQCPSFVGNSSIVTIKNVSLSFGRNCGGIDANTYRSFIYLFTGGGLATLAYSLECSIVSYEMEFVEVFGNIGQLGSNFLLVGLPLSMNIRRLNCSNGIGTFAGSGITIFVTEPPPPSFFSELIITDSVFVGNRQLDSSAGNGIALLVLSFAIKSYNQVILKSCNFTENRGVSVLRIERNNDIGSQPLVVNLTDVVLYRNGELPSRGEYDFVGVVLLINCVSYASGLSIMDSPYTGMQLVESSVTFTGNNLIQNNSFTNGGGMVILGKSYIYFRPPTVLSFIDNHADQFGGGIFVAGDDDKTYIRPCFFQIDVSSPSFLSDISIRVINNTAGVTGSFLSGGNVGVCYLTGLRDLTTAQRSSYSYLLSITRPIVRQDLDLFITSSPAGVVYCDPNVENTQRIVLQPFEFFQGKAFNISVATVSEARGLSPGDVIISVYNCSADIASCFDVRNKNPLVTYMRTSSSGCSNLTLVLTGNRYTTLLLLELRTPVHVPYDLFVPLLVTLPSADCPPGFTKDDICVCNKYVNQTGSTCNINTTTITTDGSVWIGYDSTSNCTLYSNNCPNDHCVEGNVTFNIIDSPDLQCANHRSGVLCGQCAEGYSLLLGSNECGLCPNNNYLSLLLVFGVAGITLVALLIALNLTVSVGTINGLIFYANIVKINEHVFFPRDSSQPLILRQFISFVNLDFGLKTCFYNGMTPYVKVWLQFVFPLYIWFILIAIMFLSRHFAKFSKLIGNNAVKVLATLLLLSYTKIIRTIGIVLATEMVFCNSDEYLVWRSDESIHVDSFEYIVLVIFTLLFFICLVLPYSLFLISLPFIEKLFSKMRCSFLWLKPLSDAYAGPFKDYCQYWVGFLLIYRFCLLIVNDSVEDSTIPMIINIFLILILLNLMMNTGGLYKSKYLKFLESWFLSNVLGISAFGLIGKKWVDIGVPVSVALVMLTFLGVIVFHIHQQLHHSVCKKVKRIEHSETQEYDREDINQSTKKYTVTELKMTASNDFRESVYVLLNEKD